MEPNKDISIIDCIYGLLSQVNEKIEKLSASTKEKVRIKHQALEEIDLFQRTTLSELREVFE